MQLDKLRIPTQPKTSWQCFDLGCRVAVSHYFTLFFSFIIVSLPFFVIGLLINIYWGLFIFWLLKPWYERVILYILSRGIFDTHTTIKQAVFAWPSQVKAMWFSSVTFRRLAPSRSFDMAVTQLEKLTGTQRSSRLAVLHRSSDDNTFWWTILCLVWEVFVLVGLLTLVQILFPAEVDSFSIYEALYNKQTSAWLLYSGLTFLSAAIVAPFYVAGGFIAYLNRRVILEGWDIELSFKKWRKHYADNTLALNDISASKSRLNKNQLKSVLVIAAAVVGLVQIGASEPAMALQSKAETEIQLAAEQEMQAVHDDATDDETLQIQEQNKQEIKESLENILSEPPFGGKQTVTRYRFKYSPEEEEEDEEIQESDTSWLGPLLSFSKFLASIFQFLLWGVFIALFAYILYRNWSTIESLFKIDSDKTDDVPLPTFISKSFTEKLPNDVVEAVNNAIENQEYRRALSILVRATLTKLSEQQTLRITKSMTENECLNVIEKASSSAVFNYMKLLMQQWMRMAWAHQLPNTEELTLLVNHYESEFLAEFEVPRTHSPDKQDKQGKDK